MDDELIWAKTDRYVGKLLHLKAGESLVAQYHRTKDKTLMVLSGRAQVTFYSDGESPKRQELGVRDSFRVPPELRHQFVALEDTELLEVSTTELDDLVRL